MPLRARIYQARRTLSRRELPVFRVWKGRGWQASHVRQALTVRYGVYGRSLRALRLLNHVSLTSAGLTGPLYAVPKGAKIFEGT